MAEEAMTNAAEQKSLFDVKPLDYPAPKELAPCDHDECPDHRCQKFIEDLSVRDLLSIFRRWMPRLWNMTGFVYSDDPRDESLSVAYCRRVYFGHGPEDFSVLYLEKKVGLNPLVEELVEVSAFDYLQLMAQGWAREMETENERIENEGK